MRERTEHKNLRRPLAVGIGVGVFGALAFASGILGSWSDRATDRFFLERTPDPSIVIVAIDDASITRIGRWPWDRRVHGDLIRKLHRAGAAVIGYDVNFPEPQDAQNDNALAAAMIDAGNVVLPVELPLKRTSGDGFSYAPDGVLKSITTILNAAARAGHTNTPPDDDGVVRRVPLRVADSSGENIVSAFAYEIAQFVNRAPDISTIPSDGAGRILANYPGEPGAAFPRVSAADILLDNTDLSIFKNSIVLVGSTAPNLHDEQITPVSLGAPMPGVEIHASLLDTLLSRRWLVPAPGWATALLLLALGAFMGLLIPLVRARWSALLSVAMWAAILITAFVAFDRGFVIDVVWPTFVLGAGYAMVTLERRMAAEQEKRELRGVFSRYVTPSVVDSILKDPAKLKLGGDRRRMTIFFSDIRGFTSISESMDAETLVEYLNRYLERMTDIVFSTEGTLDKYIGDAVMAFWNAPLDQADHALRGVTAALRMREALDAMNTEGAFGDLKLRVGMGLNTGEVIVGNIGGKIHTDYTVIGDAVNLASRLEGLTKEYGVSTIITEATADDLDGAILLRKLDKVAVKGKTEPVTIFEAVAESPKATKKQKTLAASFEAALDLYFSKRFREASSACDDLLRSFPDDAPSFLLRARTQHFLQEPPADDWDGTWVYTKK